MAIENLPSDIQPLGRRPDVRIKSFGEVVGSHIAIVRTTTGGAKQEVFEIEGCEVIEQGVSIRRTLYWIANERFDPNNMFTLLVHPIRDILPDWVTIYRGRSFNREHPEDRATHNLPMGSALFVGREAILFEDNE